MATENYHRIRSEIRSLTGLRGVAAVNVMLMHINAERNHILNLFAFHDSAVDIFFCLSAFTLCLVYAPGLGPKMRIKDFYVARFARIYPLYAMVLCVATLYCVGWGENAFWQYPSASSAIADGLRQIFMINAWPVIGTGAHWADPMWSLSVEALCYILVYPVVSALTRPMHRLSGESMVFGSIVVTCAAFVVYIKLYNSGINAHQVPSATGFLIHWVASLRAILMFVAGWLIYLIWLYHDDFTILAGKITNSIALCMVLIVLGKNFGLTHSSQIIILTPFLLLGLMNSTTATARLLSSRPIHFVGVISYSLYMWHWPTMILLRHVLPDVSANIQICVMVFAAFIVSILSYYFVETPLRDWIKSTFHPPTPCVSVCK